MKNFLLFLSLFFVILSSLSACVVKIPIHIAPTQQPTTQQPTTQSLADLSELDMKRLYGLGSMLAQWENQFAIGFPIVSPQYLDIIPQLASFFGGTADPEEMSKINDLTTATEFSRHLIDQIGESRGDPVHAIIELNYYVLRTTFDSSQADRVLHISIAMNALERITGDRVLISELQKIADVINNSPSDDSEATNKQLRDWLSISQYALLGQPTPVPVTPTSMATKARDDIDLNVVLPVGKASHGEELLTKHSCAGCHSKEGQSVGPAWISADGKTLSMRADETWQRSDYTGKAKNAEQYILKSIIDPLAYVVPGYIAGIQPAHYASALSAQDKADLLAYLLTLK